jgi:hypothetical protein
MIVLPSLLSEYSAAMGFNFVTRLSTNPVDSRLRRVLVSIRWETLPNLAAQFPVPMSPLLKREQDAGRPSADENRSGHILIPAPSTWVVSPRHAGMAAVCGTKAAN